MLLATLAWSGAVAEVRNPKGVAVIVGNSDYEDRDVPDAAFAHRHADAFRRYVVDVVGFDPENVIDLRDARRREMFDALGSARNPRGRLWSYLDPEGGSDVVVFYSGHGVPGKKDKRGYLLPVDGSPQEAEEDGYPLDLLYRNLGNLKEARSVVVYLDAGFSGSSHRGDLTRSAEPVNVGAVPPKELSKKVTVLMAATGAQLASWDERARHGLFTHHLLDALYGKGDVDKDGKVTARRRSGEKKTEKAAAREKPPVAEPEVALAMEKRVLVQRGLASLGFDPGPVDGIFAPKTRKAVRAWQKAKGYGVTGRLTKVQAGVLVAVGDVTQRGGGRARAVGPGGKGKAESRAQGARSEGESGGRAQGSRGSGACGAQEGRARA